MNRRDAFKAVVGLGFWFPATGQGADADPDIANAPPQEGDVLVFAYGEREGEVIIPGDLTIEAKPIFAFPMDVATETAKSASRLNQLLVKRINPESLADETRARSADNIVAYSAVCTHTGCDITGWDKDVHRFKCPCHESQFDPADGAKVVGGPAPWQLAALPLKIVDGMLAVAGDFVGRVGFQQPGTDPFAFR